MTRVETQVLNPSMKLQPFLTFQKSKRLKPLLHGRWRTCCSPSSWKWPTQRSQLKNHLGADFFDVASEEEVANAVQAGFGSLGPVGLPENVKIIADRKVQDVRNAVVGLTKMVTTWQVWTQAWLYCRICGYPRSSWGWNFPRRTRCS